MEKTLRSDARRNLELILRAAGEVFAEQGPEVGVAEIARRAGVGTATIFRRFPTKEDLLAAVFESRLREITDIAQGVLETPGLGALRAFYLGAIEFQVRDRGFLETVGKRRFAGDPRFVAARDDIVAALDDMLERAQATGEVRDDVTATDVLVLMHALVSASAFLGGDGGARGRYVDLVLDGLRAESATVLSAPPPTIEQLDRAGAGGCEA